VLLVIKNISTKEMQFALIIDSENNQIIENNSIIESINKKMKNYLHLETKIEIYKAINLSDEEIWEVAKTFLARSVQNLAFENMFVSEESIQSIMMEGYLSLKDHLNNYHNNIVCKL
jgi:hypothetical protein